MRSCSSECPILRPPPHTLFSRATPHLPTFFETLQAGDAFATSRLAVGIVKLCFEQRDMKLLNAQILVLTKRRGQLKQVGNEG